jgi:hypothetical protein
MKKPTLFLPMLGDGYREYTRPFDGKLENLWCPHSTETMSRDLSAALSMRDWQPADDYQTVVRGLVGSADFDEFGRALGAALKRDGRTADVPPVAPVIGSELPQAQATAPVNGPA